jgi:integrase/recombinase XerD
MSNLQISLARAIAAFLQAKQAAGLSPNTIRNYRNTFAKLDTYLEGTDPPFGSLDIDAMTGFLAWCQAATFEPDGVAPRGAFRLSAKSLLNLHTDLSALWTWAKERGLVAENIIRRIEAPDPDDPVIIPFTKEDIERLVAACVQKRTWKTQVDRPPDARPTAERDRALILLLVDTGLRASEVCALQRADLDMAQQAARVRHGKGDKERIVHFGKRTAKALWQIINAVPAGGTKECLFTVGPTTDARPLDRSVLCRLLKRIGERAGVGDVYPHKFRHTFAINYLRNGGDVFTLQALLGHTDLEMVQRYLNIVQTDCARVHAKASPVDNWKL